MQEHNEKECWENIGANSMMNQEEYDELYKSELTEHLTMERAAQMIANDLGFQEDKVQILTEVPEMEIGNRKTRIVGMCDRSPCYASSDWNYIHFDVCGWRYELINGELYIYE